MTALFGTGLASVVLIGWALADLDEPYAGWLIAAGTIYVIGEIATTGGYHVPRNNALAAGGSRERGGGSRVADLPGRVDEDEPRPHGGGPRGLGAVRGRAAGGLEVGLDSQLAQGCVRLAVGLVAQEPAVLERPDVIGAL